MIELRFRPWSLPALFTTVSAVLLTTMLPATVRAQGPNPIVLENQQPGTSAWRLGDSFGRPYGTDAAGNIKGYVSATSVNKGQSLTFFVSVNPSQTFTIDIYRIGWYQGLGGRLMQHVGPLNGVRQNPCPVNSTTGLIECNWTPSFTLTMPTTWTSGVYLVVLRNAQGFHNYSIFTLRDDDRVADFLYQQPVTTYQANNNYPDDNATGKSTYENNSFGPDTIAGTPRAVKVSFDRPYANEGDGNFLHQAEVNNLRWLERSGYDITYSTNLDTHRSGQRLLNYRAFLSLPHDEYWSTPMLDAAFAARDAGVNLAFFGANSIYWQVRFEPSTSGVPDRIMVTYKDELIDPISNPALQTVKWRDGPVQRPEQMLMGIEYTNGPENGWVPYVVTNSNHWAYAGTGLRNGDTVPGIVGTETDRLVSQDPLPAALPGSHVLLSHSPFIGSHNDQDHSSASIYQALSGSWVFASGTMMWGWALDDFYTEGTVETVDARIQAMTANILQRFLTSSNLAPTALAAATPLEGPGPLTVTFSSAGSSDPEGQPLTNLWNFGDGATSTSGNPSHTYTQNGSYAATLTVSDGAVSDSATPLVITVGARPVPTILTPSSGLLFRAGNAIAVSGDATDADETLPAGAYAWQIDLLRGSTVQPAHIATGTKSFTFTIPTVGHDFSGDARYRITLTVTDSDGLSATRIAIILPDKVNLTFATVPSGVAIKIDGVSHMTPFTYDTLINFTHTIDAPNQIIGSNSYAFQSWSDDGTQQHTIAVGTTEQNYSASFTIAALAAPLVFAQNKGGFVDASGTTLTVQLTNVKPGSLIVAYAKWEGTAAATVTLSDGTSTFVPDTLNSAGNNDLHGRFYYLLSSAVFGTVNYTATWSAARPYRRLLIYEYTYGGTLAFEASNRARGTSGSLNTGNITATGLDEVVFGAYGEYNVNNTVSESINGLAANQVIRTGFSSMWSRIFASGFTGAATATGNSSTWIGNVIAFKHTRTPISNTQPSISAIAPQTIAEDTSTGAVAFTVGDNQAAPGSLTLSATSSNPLVPAANIVFGGSGENRTVTVTPLPNQSGTATITISVSDGLTATSTDFLLTVNGVNDLPTISTVANQTTNAGTAIGPLTLTVGDIETAADSLTLSGGSSNTTLLPVSGITFGGSGTARTVTATPASGQTGTATVTLTVGDGTATASSTFLLTVNAVNTAPTITALNPQTISEDANTGALSFTVGDAETAAGSLTLTGSTTNPALVPLANIVFGGAGTNRTVTVTPLVNQSGTATITVTVSDGQLTTPRSFLLTVTAVNDLPTISGLSNQSTSQGVAIGPLAVTVGDVETAAASLVLTGASSNTTLLPVSGITLGGSGTSRTVTLTPASGQAGTATVTLTVGDGTATASSIFVLTVIATNTPPTISALSPQTIPEDAGTGTLSFTIADAQTAAGSLTLSGSTSNATLVPVANIVFGGSGTNRTVTVTPLANQSGTATVTVTVSDGQLTAASSFLLTVNAVNDLPTISTPANLNTSMGVAVGPLPVTVGDVETAAASLVLTGASSNTTLLPVSGISFGGSGTARTVTLTPAAGQIGTSTVTLTVNDGTGTVSSSFLLTVTAAAPQPLTFAQNIGAFADADGTSLSVQLTNVKPGSLIVAYVKWEGSAAATVSLSDGTSTFTADAQNSAANDDLHGRFFYLLSSTASGTVTYTATWNAARPYRKVLLYEYNYSGVVTVDGSNRATGTAGNLTTGAITTTGSDEVVFGAYGEYNTNNTTNEQVNGVAADRVLRNSFASMWSKGVTAPFTGAATATGNSSTWIGNVIAFRRN